MKHKHENFEQRKLLNGPLKFARIKHADMEKNRQLCPNVEIKQQIVLRQT